MRITLFLGLIAGILFSGCEKIDEFTKFDFTFSSTVTIPATSVINLPIDILTPEIETNAESTFSVNDTDKELIEEILLKSMDLSIQSPTGGSFTFLKKIEIYLNAEDLPELLIAYDEDVSNGVGANLELTAPSQDLARYLIKDKIALRVYTITDETINQDHEIQVNSTFKVDAKILGQ